MALGDNTGNKLNWQDVKQKCSQADIERMACLGMCYINQATVDKSLYAEAARQFGGNIKPASYQRGLWVISKKLADAASSSASSTPSKGSSKAGNGSSSKASNGKRKVTPDEDEDDEEETPKRAKKGGKGGKKAAESGGAVESPVKQEGEGHDLDDVFQ